MQKSVVAEIALKKIIFNIYSDAFYIDVSICNYFINVEIICISNILLSKISTKIMTFRHDESNVQNVHHKNKKKSENLKL